MAGVLLGSRRRTAQNRLEGSIPPQSHSQRGGFVRTHSNKNICLLDRNHQALAVTAVASNVTGFICDITVAKTRQNKI